MLQVLARSGATGEGSATDTCGIGRLAPSVRLGLAHDVMPLLLPLLLAATPLPSDTFVPYVPPAGPAATGESQGSAPVQTFDPVGRAELLNTSLPRLWVGEYRPFSGAATAPAQLQIDSSTPLGQMLYLRGRLTIGGVETPFQANLNAKSDQLDLLFLGDRLPSGMEPGGEVMGLQGLSLSGWQPPRLTSLGGRLALQAQLPPAPARIGKVGPRRVGPPVRGLW